MITIASGIFLYLIIKAGAKVENGEWAWLCAITIDTLLIILAILRFS